MNLESMTRVEQVRYLHDEKFYSQNRIAGELCISRAAVREYMRLGGVEPRTIKDAVDIWYQRQRYEKLKQEQINGEKH